MNVVIRVLLIIAVVVLTSDASAQEGDDYQRLVETSRGAHAALENAPDDARRPLLDFALQSDLALASWIDGWLAREDAEASGDEERAERSQAWIDAELRVAAILIQQNQCVETAGRLEALRTRLPEASQNAGVSEAAEEAETCLPATLYVEAFPADATLSIDGAVLGPASEPYPISAGSHELRLEAPGFLSEHRVVEVPSQGMTLVVGPIYLAERPPAADRSALPRWYEWTLWGVGAVGVGIGAGFVLGANDIRTQLDRTFQSPGFEDFVSEQEDNAETKEIIGWATIGAGVVAIGAGTWLYASRQANKVVPPGAPDLSPRWYEWSLWGLAGAGFGWAASLLTQSVIRNGYADDLGGEIGADTPGVEGLRDRADELRFQGAIVGTAAALLAVTGTAAYVIRTAQDDPEGGLRVDAAITPEGGAFVLTVPF